MRLKTFSAATMQEAMAEVRKALGPDAMIVSSQQARGGGAVKVVAAVEGPVRKTEPATFQEALASQDGLSFQLKDGKSLAARLATAAKEIRPAAPVEAPVTGISPIPAAFERHGVPRHLADMLVQMAAQVEALTPELTLAGALDAACRFLPIAASQARPLLLVGAPGVGKTSSIAKLAARAALEARSVKLFTTDIARSGGVEQLAGYAELLDLQVTVAQGPTDLAARMAPALKKKPDLILVDTAGINPFSAPELNALMQLAQAIDGEIVAVVAAGGDAGEASELAQIYTRIGAWRFIATRLDATRRFGSLISLGGGPSRKGAAGGLAFAGVSATPFIGEGLQAINPVSLARLLMSSPAAGAVPVLLPESKLVTR